MELSKFYGALLGTFVGDAFGLPFEFSSVTTSQKKQVSDRCHEINSFWGYSDDTEMMIGLAESLIEDSNFDPEKTLRTLARNYEPARGYGKGIKLTFRYFQEGEDIDKVAYRVWEDGSKGNGASSRIAPVACLYCFDEERLKEKLEVSAKLTHAHPMGVKGALIQGLSIGYLIKCASINDFDPHAFISYLFESACVEGTVYEEKLKFIQQMMDKSISMSEGAGFLGNGVLAEESVPLSLFIFLRSLGDFKQTIRFGAEMGGDTDSICAMSGALCGALMGIEAIPATWLVNLEKSGKGYTYVKKLCEDLFQIFKTAFPRH